MIFDDDDGGLSPIAKKLLLLGAVLVGVPLIALGIGALLSSKDRRTKRKAKEEEERKQAEEPAEPPVSSHPQAEPPESSHPEAEPPESSSPPAESPAPSTPEPEPVTVEPEPEVPKAAATVTELKRPAFVPAAVGLKPTGTAPAEATGEAVSRESILQTLTLLLSDKTEIRPDPDEQSLEDRRQAVRLRVEFPVQVRATGISQATAIDLSLTGVRLKIESPLLIGENCYLSLPGQTDAEVSGIVMWCISGDSGTSRAGLRFNDSPEKLTNSWVVDHLIEAGLHESQLAQKRRWIRVRTQAPVKVRDEKEQEHEATMLDIGAGGAMISTKAPLNLREGVRLVIPTGKKRTAIALSANVVAGRDQEYHLQFLPPGKGLQKRLETYIIELLQTDK